MIHSLHCSPPKTEPFMRKGEGNGHRSFQRILHSSSETLLLGPSQKALKEKITIGSEVMSSWHYLCYYYILLLASVLLLQQKETACSLRCCDVFEMTQVIKHPQSSGSAGKSLWLLAAVYLRWRGAQRGQVIRFEKFGAGGKKPTPPSLGATLSPFILEDFQQQTNPQQF